MRLVRSAFGPFSALGILLVSSSALAQPAGTDVALAEALYQKGRQLMGEGKYAEACPKFAESYRLDAATGTLLNLASCHEGERKLATAWLEFSEALASAKRDHRDDRVHFAEEHLAAIEPKLSRLTLVLATGADRPELKVQIDGVLVLAAARGVPAPVDPGEHVVQAQAPGRKSWSQRVSITEQAQNVTVTVPVLENETPTAAVPPIVPTPPVAPPASPPAPEVIARPTPSSVYVAGGVTLALAVGASVTGGVYLSNWSDAKSQPDPAYTRTYRWGAISTALTVGALAGAGVTTYLYLTRPSQTTRSASLMVAPWASASGGGLSIGGSL